MNSLQKMNCSRAHLGISENYMYKVRTGDILFTWRRECIPAIPEGVSSAHNIRTIFGFLLQLQAIRGKHPCGS
jgi:hypothetical protein